MLTLIGDVHGKTDKYLEICNSAKYTVQLGDLNFDYDFLKEVDSTKHKFIHGNHDNIDILSKGTIPHFLGRYGFTTLGGISFFYVSGAYSIDRQFRTIGLDWFPNEELSLKEAEDCLKLYKEIKPTVVLAHDFPVTVKEKLFGYKHPMDTITNKLLQEMVDFHKPHSFIAGHHHVSILSEKIDKTRYTCLNELETLTLW